MIVVRWANSSDTAKPSRIPDNRLRSQAMAGMVNTAFRNCSVQLFDLFEAPISKIETHYMDEPGTFSDSERRALRNPQQIEKIEKRFSNSKVDFSLYFVNQVGKDFLSAFEFDDGYRQGIFSKAWKDAAAHAGFSSPEIIGSQFGLSIEPDLDAINVVFLSNANAENPVALTPWMVAHRIGHAITDGDERPGDLQRLIPQLPEDTSLVGQLPLVLREEFPDAPQHLRYTEAASMRSARSGQLSGDLAEELIAQYIITGKVTLRLPDHWTDLPPKVLDYWTHRVREQSVWMTGLIARILDLCIGHVLLAI